MLKKKNTNSLISELKRKTRRNYASEEKIRIINLLAQTKLAYQVHYLRVHKV